MSARQSIYVSNRIPFMSPPSPNATQDFITVEIRVFYPPNVSPLTLLEELAAASAEAVRKIAEAFPE